MGTKRGHDAVEVVARWVATMANGCFGMLHPEGGRVGSDVVIKNKHAAVLAVDSHDSTVVGQSEQFGVGRDATQLRCHAIFGVQTFVVSLYLKKKTNQLSN